MASCDVAEDPEIELGPRDYHLEKRDGRRVAFHEAFAPKQRELQSRPVWPGQLGLWAGAGIIIACILVVPSLGYLLALLGGLAALGVILLGLALQR